MDQMPPVLRRFFRFYYDGFKNMPEWGRRVWLIIVIKLFIMFAILKIFFFLDFIYSKYETDKQRSEYVLDQLIKPPASNDGKY